MQVNGGLLNHDTLSMQDMNNERQEPKAFCNGKKCVAGLLRKLFKVNKLGFAVRVFKTVNGNCPKCSHAVFYSTSYKQDYRKFAEELNAKTCRWCTEYIYLIEGFCSIKCEFRHYREVLYGRKDFKKWYEDRMEKIKNPKKKG